MLRKKRTYRIRRGIFHGLVVSYACPRCATLLKSPIEDSGLADACPSCGSTIVVPGEIERRTWAETDSTPRPLVLAVVSAVARTVRNSIETIAGIWQTVARVATTPLFQSATTAMDSADVVPEQRVRTTPKVSMQWGRGTMVTVVFLFLVYRVGTGLVLGPDSSRDSDNSFAADVSAVYPGLFRESDASLRGRVRDTLQTMEDHVPETIQSMEGHLPKVMADIEARMMADADKYGLSRTEVRKQIREMEAGARENIIGMEDDAREHIRGMEDDVIRLMRQNGW